MNKKGMEMLGVMLMTIIGILVGITLFAGSIVPTIGTSTTTATIVNRTMVKSATGEIYFGVQAIEPGSFVAYKFNATSGKTLTDGGACGTHFNTTLCILSAGNFTLTSRVLNPTTGELDTRLTWNTNGLNQTFNATFVAEPRGYVSDSGARSVTTLILIFTALAIAILALMPVLKEALDF